MLPDSVIEFILHAERSIIMAVSLEKPYFTLAMQPEDDRAFYLDILTKIGKLHKLRVLTEIYDGSADEIRIHLYPMIGD